MSRHKLMPLRPKIGGFFSEETEQPQEEPSYTDMWESPTVKVAPCPAFLE